MRPGTRKTGRFLGRRTAQGCLAALLVAGTFGGQSPARELPALAAPADVLGEATRPPATVETRREALAELFIQAGALPTDIAYHAFRWRGAVHRNLVVTLPGSGDGIFIIGAHVDTDARGTGAVDNWASCVVLAQLFHRVRATHPASTWIFIGFAAEEHGQHGSAAFVTGLPREARARVRAMVNIECLGIGHLRTWANASADILETLLARAAEEEGAEFSRDILFGYSADSFTFTRAGIPSVTLHSLSPGDLRVINSADDTPDRIRPERVREAFHILARYMDILDAYGEPIPDTDAEATRRQARSILHQAARRAAQAAVAGDAALPEGVPLLGIPVDSAEYRAGVRDRDVLRSIAGYAVSTPDELAPILRTLHEGVAVPLSLTRTGLEGDGGATVLKRVDVMLTVQY